MGTFLGFICQYCDSMQSESFEYPADYHRLHSTSCTECGHVITVRVKQSQIKDYEYSLLQVFFSESSSKESIREGWVFIP